MAVTERVPLSRDRIAAAGLAFVDAHGLDGLSMRKLGASLGVEAMSLYNHVDNKDDLLGAVLDSLYREILTEYGDPQGDWKARARAMSMAYWHACDRHPNAVPLIVDQPVRAADGLAFLARLVEIFTGLTDDLEQAALAFNTAANWVVGAVLNEHGLMKRLAAGEGITADTVPPEFLPLVRFKDLCAVATAPEARFEEGLETMLLGLEARYG